MTQNNSPQLTQTYTSLMMESVRWKNFEPRPDDIIICTAPKCGTTWMQMICALLIFQEPELKKPLSEYSPWLDMLVLPVDEALDKLTAQTHRRFIKTHTPLDGLPYFDDVTYLVVGRDPRDAFMSMQPHKKNMNPEKVMAMMDNALHDAEIPAPSEDSLSTQFQKWMAVSADPAEGGLTSATSVLNYISSFWQYRHMPNIHFIHYSDLKADLGSQMERVANILDIQVSKEKWPALINAATFESMKSNADNVAPDAEKNLWHNNSGFFNSGKSGQWQGLLNDEDIAVFHQQLKERASPELAYWLEHGGKVS
ncbi:MAG: sulfotransferase domain-containing protein [Pseudomonadales bacterium]|nr:sulfotransferase domain-containing protein [Pseudomonadales bacterium]